MADRRGDSTKRSANFSEKEVDLLVNLVNKYIDIIECKKTDATTWRAKAQTWEKLCNEFNSCSDGVVRCAKNLRMKYENVKKCNKKKFAEEKREINKTGDGIQTTVQITPVDNLIKNMIEGNSTGLQPIYESDVMINVPAQSQQHKWETWNGTALRGSISAALLPNVEIEEVEFSEAGDTLTQEKTSGSRIGKRKKSDFSADCQVKYSKLSDARIELIELQKESVKQEMELKKEEHDRKMEYMKSEFEMGQEKLKLEILLLRKKLNEN
ncbi:myb/SANT-like DNA-binding domain-containing protein 3 [Periplaneta americana]|uniref:myb/SANT-like DNA-binding domain-containing protein 3 n=1 Tax=Periplaneta americana TaxID=6978 RepID=UPI0037E7315C